MSKVFTYGKIVHNFYNYKGEWNLWTSLEYKIEYFLLFQLQWINLVDIIPHGISVQQLEAIWC